MKALKAVKKKTQKTLNQKFTAVDAPSFTPPDLTHYSCSSCLLFVSLMKSHKTLIFLIWNDFQFCLTDGLKLLLHGECSCALRTRFRTICQIQSQSTAKLQVRQFVL